MNSAMVNNDPDNRHHGCRDGRGALWLNTTRLVDVAEEHYRPIYGYDHPKVVIVAGVRSWNLGASGYVTHGSAICQATALSQRESHPGAIVPSPRNFIEGRPPESGTGLAATTATAPSDSNPSLGPDAGCPRVSKDQLGAVGAENSIHAWSLVRGATPWVPNGSSSTPHLKAEKSFSTRTPYMLSSGVWRGLAAGCRRETALPPALSCR